jgi:transcriptional regulator with PAS, ATPase and Fis domain
MRSRAGLFVPAQRGTLFLDEIGELPQALPSKLLRALQERKVRPVGGDSTFGAQSRRGQCASPNERASE